MASGVTASRVGNDEATPTDAGSYVLNDPGNSPDDCKAFGGGTWRAFVHDNCCKLHDVATTCSAAYRALSPMHWHFMSGLGKLHANAMRWEPHYMCVERKWWRLRVRQRPSGSVGTCGLAARWMDRNLALAIEIVQDSLIPHGLVAAARSHARVLALQRQRADADAQEELRKFCAMRSDSARWWLGTTGENNCVFVLKPLAVAYAATRMDSHWIEVKQNHMGHNLGVFGKECHNMIMHDECDPLPPEADARLFANMWRCWRVGVCLCCENGTELRSLRNSVLRVLKANHICHADRAERKEGNVRVYLHGAHPPALDAGPSGSDGPVQPSREIASADPALKSVTIFGIDDGVHTLQRSCAWECDCKSLSFLDRRYTWPVSFLSLLQCNRPLACLLPSEVLVAARDGGAEPAFWACPPQTRAPRARRGRGADGRGRGNGNGLDIGSVLDRHGRGRARGTSLALADVTVDERIPPPPLC